MSQTNLIANTYNPHNQTPRELIDGFVVRKKEFESLYNDIRTDRMEHPPQHAIIQGRRGSGKTTFLLRLYYEIKRDETINKWLVPLVFNEEQYNVRTLYKLWENIAVELESDYEDFSSLPDDMQAGIEAPDYENICFNLLTSALQKHKKKLLLLIDNFGSMLLKFDEQEQHRLREILMTSSDIKIIGASSVALESTFDYSKPFFEFFKIVELSGLSKEETTTLLLALGEQYHKQEIKTIIEQKPGKIEALRRLTDGVPRTMILLFEIFVDDAAGDSFKDLEMVLDRVTPLYKHRMDELPAQQQELVDIIALQWDAVAVKEIAAKARMESKAVSAQLRMLEKNRIVIKKTTSTKNHLYQISERFFNIWYLMRYGRKKERHQVKWLARFLEEWCNRENSAVFAQYQIKVPNHASKVMEHGAETKSELLNALMLLRNDDIEKSAAVAKPLFEDQEIFENENLVENYLFLLIAKNQYNLVYRLFMESTFDLRERYKPIYYALMYFMKDMHPDEFRKMGSELEQTVLEIVEEINTMARTM
jgi:hypothetical protein